MKVNYVLLYFMLLPGSLFSQQQLSLEEAIAAGLKNSPLVQSAQLDVERQQALKRAAAEVPKTDVAFMYGQYNSYVKNDNNITIAQSIPFPTFYTSQHALGKAQIKSSELQKTVTVNEVILQIKQTFYELLYLKSRHILLLRQDSLFQELVRSASLRYKTGEGTLLEKTAAETQHSEIGNTIRQNEANQRIALQQLRTLINQNQVMGITGTLTERPLPSFDSSALLQNPQLQYWQQQVVVARQQKKTEVARAMPDLKIGYFNQTLIGFQNVSGQETYFGSSDRFQGFEVGLSIPLWFFPHSAKTQAAKINQQVSERKFAQAQLATYGQFQQAVEAFVKNQSSLQYYKNTALPNAELLQHQNQLSFKNGETNYAIYLMNLKNVITIQESYLQTLNDYNQTIIYLEYLSGITQ